MRYRGSKRSFGASVLAARTIENITCEPASWKTDFDYRKVTKISHASVDRSLTYRQFKNEPRAAQCGLVVRSNASIVRFNDRLGDRKTQAHAGFLGRKEAIEQMWQMLRLDAGATILNDATYRS